MLVDAVAARLLEGVALVLAKQLMSTLIRAAHATVWETVLLRNSLTPAAVAPLGMTFVGVAVTVAVAIAMAAAVALAAATP